MAVAGAVLGVAVLTPIAIGGTKDEGESPRQVEVVSAVGDRPAQATEDKLTCTSEREPANFGLYALGESFEGLPLTTVIRSCGNPAPVPGDNPHMPSTWRQNSVSYLYGDCEIPAGEGGCGTPLEVQSTPVCERNVTLYDNRPELTERRGVPSAAMPGRIELYTGDSTVVIFGTDEDLIERAAAAIQPVRRGDPPEVVPPVMAKASTLAPPVPGAMSGERGCSR